MIEVIELGHDGTLTTMPEPGDAPTSAPVVPQEQTGALAETAPGSTPGVQEGSAPQTETPPPAGEALAVSPPVEEDDADVPDDTATIPYVNRRIKQLRAQRSATEKQLADERSQNALRQAQLEAKVDTLTRVLSGAAPDMPAAPPQPTGPPQAEQYDSHDAYLDARSTWNAQRVAEQDRQQAQMTARQQQLVQQVERFKQAHSDYETVMQAGYYGKVAPHVDQVVSNVPDGPALAYVLAQQPALVQRFNTMPPAQVLWELARLTPPTANGSQGAPPVTPTPPTPPLPEPMAPVGGGGSMAAPTYTENMSQREYEQYRARTSQLPYVKRS